MSSNADRPDRPPVARFLEALEVRRNVLISVIVGVIFTVLTFVFFVVIPGTAQQMEYLLALAFVLATTVAGSVLILLLIYQTVQLSRELQDGEPH